MTRSPWYNPIFSGQKQDLQLLLYYLSAECRHNHLLWLPARWCNIRLHCNITPLLLLDDIFDKFDSQHVSHIVHLVSGDNFGQIFITDTGREHIENILKQSHCTHQLFEINAKKELADEQ
ncbi:hypothetical protein FACS189430_06870 [Bacteroidia bacterium]|nr:hypothetical protein FACS189430_06870 [Bacteroidia bacterium]